MASIPPPLKELNISTKASGFYKDFNQIVSVASKIILSMIVVWAIIDTEGAGQILKDIQNWSFQNLNAYYIYTVAFFIITCLVIAIWPRFGKIRLGEPDGKPEFSTFSWFSMMFGAGIGIGMLGYAAGEPIWHLATNPDIIMSKNAIMAAFAQANFTLPEGADVFAAYQQQVGLGTISTIDGIIAPKSLEALDSVYRYTFLHWGLGAWACYALIGISLSFFTYKRGLPLTIRSGLVPLFGKKLEGPLGHIVDITAVLATILGIGQTIGLGLTSFASGVYNITGAEWLVNVNATGGYEPTTASLLVALAIVMLCSTASALSGVGKGIKWLSNINMVLSFGLLAFFLILGSTLFSLELFGTSVVSYVMHLPAMTFTVWDPSTELGSWQTGWSVFYWAWWIAFAPFVGIFLARISKNRTIREFVAGAIVLPSLMCFVWFTFVGGTAIDLELSGVADGRIFNAGLTARLYEVMNVMLSPGGAQFMSVMIVILLLTYLVTSADSAILVVNTINSGGNRSSSNPHILLWGGVLAAVITALLLAGGLGAIQSAMIIGAVPFSFMMILMGISLIKALWRDSVREKQTADTNTAQATS